MAPQPKRKHSKARKGKRVEARKSEQSLPQLVLCKNCGRRKLSQQQCKNCNK
ncbi:MAG: 50S ribosomal protein L32 [Candidatus Roizmanbacteria bacterium]|uniref:Large ribosomal subunit protein bL32 n=2 Tax=Candidatus Roizmaniibacteriota TaxID=1752723 RepID=A0A2M8EYS6_9BACT|nr:50S ribosomal protein L32 [Candidatus Roizmanbacteria bacterium]PIZ65785.1 MAG: 50S ribosomal protein L32 [Candidatus Roizmanbacteria bacterium CG_4_10_14_0_2_um_filter_39_12]PJC31777.1 MAG: 50S ribosomal protein L32 [Candidatus Roizmanbacteria bacterium CG_4_9_14_0_2_um_filter_39_13]PJE61373.1 MAG: 50S ribosomal protein L32 [Candidatus Roizmanbacteria bacterium CG10_big_fil_rev_8_21_14_0_10_39_12]